jgi:hypothetical protein
MAGEVWREQLQIGRETVYNTPVVATRRLYVMDPSINRTRAPRPKRFATGTRDNQRAHTLGPVVVDGSVKSDVSGGELLEWLELTFGAAVVTTPAGATLARLHTFKPLNTVPSATLERQDGAVIKRVTGVMVDKLGLAGDVAGENACTFGLFGGEYLDWVGPLTSLTDRIPTFMEGWQTNVYLDAISGAAGTTVVANAGINWKMDYANNLGRKRWAGNTLALGALTSGIIDLTASVTLEAAAAVSAAEVAHWEAQDNRVLRLEFLGPVDGIESGQREFVTFDIPGAWSTVNFNATDEGTRVYEMGLEYVYSTVLAAGLVVRAQSNRLLAFAA